MLVSVLSGFHRGTTWEMPELGGFQVSQKPEFWLATSPQQAESLVAGVRPVTSRDNFYCRESNTNIFTFNLPTYLDILKQPGLWR
ncbi:hypothetical protein [Levilactobacillus fujinensis]